MIRDCPKCGLPRLSRCVPCRKEYERVRNKSPERRAAKRAAKEVEKLRRAELRSSTPRPSKEEADARRRQKRAEAFASNPVMWRDKSYRRKYGMTFAQVAEQLARQNNSCAICARGLDINHASDDRGVALWVVDHDHATREVRGILCAKCNHGLGLWRDRVDHFQAAAAYLLNPPARGTGYTATAIAGPYAGKKPKPKWRKRTPRPTLSPQQLALLDDAPPHTGSSPRLAGAAASCVGACE